MNKDFLGRPIKVGDTVVYLQHSRSSSSLRTSKVVSIKGEKMIALESGNKSRDKLIVINAQIQNNYSEYPEEFI